MRYLPDTNILIHAMARDGRALRRRMRIHSGAIAHSAVFYTSSISARSAATAAGTS